MAEHPAVNRRVAGSSPAWGVSWSVGQGVKTPPFHGGNMGSNPIRIIKIFPVMMRSGDTPVPIPNTTVKTWAVDGTWWAAAWESRWLPEFNKPMWLNWQSSWLVISRLSVRVRSSASFFQYISFGSLAQSVEHWTFNPGVPGSSPGWLIHTLVSIRVCLYRLGFFCVKKKISAGTNVWKMTVFAIQYYFSML